MVFMVYPNKAMEDHNTIIPEEIVHPLTFKDIDQCVYHLSPSAYKHIKRDHCIMDPCDFIKDTLADPCVITGDKTKEDRWIYHRDRKNKTYKVVVACTTEKKIKTAFISDDVKGGNVIWMRKGLLNK